MGSIILTGISHGKHQFSLTYPEVDGVMICMAHCKCGYEVEILYFKNYGGIKYLQKMWEIHIGTWKGWFNYLVIKWYFLELFVSMNIGATLTKT